MSSVGQYSPEYLSEYIGDRLILISAVFIALESIFVALRCYARTLTISSLGWDDIIIPVAWLANIGICILGIRFVRDAGVGRHQAAVWKHYNSQDIVSWGKSLYALEWLYLTAVALSKISILGVYLRIFTSRAARSGCYVLIGIIAANWATFILISTFECSPPAYKWDKTIANGRCLDLNKIAKVTGVSNIVTDLAMLVLPVPTVRRLNASYMRKLGLMVVFMAGSVGIIASCARMATYWRPNAFTDFTCMSSPIRAMKALLLNYTLIEVLIGSAVSLITWTIIECGMYLIAASLLTLRPVFAQLSRHWSWVRLNHIGLRKPNLGANSGSRSVSLQHLPSATPRYESAGLHHTDEVEQGLVVRNDLQAVVSNHGGRQ